MKKVSPKLNKIFRVSVALNILLLTLITIYIFRNQDKIKQKIILAMGEPELIMFGDSHTAKANWTSLLSNYRVISLGFSGMTSDQLKNLMMIKVLPLKPEFCFIQGGGNDINSRCFDRKILLANIQEMIDSLQSYNIQPVIQSLFKRYDAREYNLQVDSINVLLLKLAKNEGIDFLNVNENLVDENGLKKINTLEGIHLNDEGYCIWANQVKKYLESKSD
jgi:lysophospholipase L1-like esterase